MTDRQTSDRSAALDGPASERYSLAGVRQATTAPHEAFIAKAREVLAGDDRVLGAYLVGGFAVGMGDAFSDVDLHIVVATKRPTSSRRRGRSSFIRSRRPSPCSASAR